MSSRYTASASAKGLKFTDRANNKSKSLSWPAIALALAEAAEMDSIVVSGVGVLPMAVLINYARAAMATK